MLFMSQIRKLDSALKVLNQRIAEIGKPSRFGKTSNVYKQVIGIFETKDLKPYVGTSKSGNFKFNIRAINKALKDGKPHPELERIINVAGFREGKPGFLKATKEGKTIPTITEIFKKWDPFLNQDGTRSKESMYDEIDEAVTLSDDLTTLIYEFKETFGQAELEKEFPELFGKGRGQLSKSAYQKIKAKLIQRLANYKKEERRKSAEFVDSFKNV